MKYSIFSHKKNPQSDHSRELRRDDVECFSQTDLSRHKSALEQKGYKIGAVVTGLYGALEDEAGRDRKSRPAS